MPDLASIRITLVIVFVVIFIVVITVIFIVMCLRKRKILGSTENPIINSISHNRVGLSVDKMSVIPNEDCDCGLPSENSYMNDNSAYFGGSSNKHHYTEMPEVMLKLHNDNLAASMTKPNFHQPDVIQSDLFHQTQSSTPQLLYDYTYALPHGFALQSIQTHSTPMGTMFFIPAQSYQEGPEISHHFQNLQQSVHLPPPSLPHTIQVVPEVHSAPQNIRPNPKLQNTPLARLSVSSASSEQTLRILTLQDISRKLFQQSALESAATSSGDVSKGVLQSSNSEISWNRPIAPSDWSFLSGGILSVEGTDRGNCREAPGTLIRPTNSDDKNLGGNVNSCTSGSNVMVDNSVSAPVKENQSSTTTQSGDDSFTCSEYEDDSEINNGCQSVDRQPFMVTADQDASVSCTDSFSTSSEKYFPKNVNADRLELNEDATLLLSSDYLLNWGPNFEFLVGVCNDIAELPDTISGANSATNNISTGSARSTRSKEVYV